jgi:predicted AlkP superfamily pyrophosphatase or phosphodiesterase
VSDHQVAHVYVADPADIPRVRDMLKSLAGVDEVLDRAEQAKYGIDHERAGELVVVADPDAWFTYYYWLDDDRAPDFARGVEIHRKPGYDPAELFFNPADKLAKAKAGLNLVRKKVGLRYSMQVVPLDPSYVRGSHGRLPLSDDDGPVMLCSVPDAEPGGSVSAVQVRDLLLQLQGVDVSAVSVSEGARR